MEDKQMVDVLRETAQRYTEAADILAGRKKPMASASKPKRFMSAAARARIAKAQRARWKKFHAKKAA